MATTRNPSNPATVCGSFDHRHVAGRGQPRDHTENDPADEIIGHSGGDRDLTDVASHQTQIGQDLRNHGKGRHSDTGCDEQCEHQPFRRLPVDRTVELFGHSQADDQASDERNHDAADG